MNHSPTTDTPIGTNASGKNAPLFDPRRHETLLERSWDEERAREAIARVVDDAHRAFSRDGGWAAHALDTEGDGTAAYGMLYFGAAGVAWALDHLARSGASSRGTTEAQRAHLSALVEPNRRFCEGRGNGTTSLLMGDVGIWLTQHRLAPDAKLLELIEQALRDCVDHPARELTWGAPGTMLPALWLYEETGDERWAARFRECADAAWASMVHTEQDTWLWNHRFQGLSLWALGAGHGFAGAAFPLVAGRALLGEERTAELFARMSATVGKTAFVHGDLANWPKYLPPYCELTERYREQIGPEQCILHVCHGAPGMVLGLGGVPRGDEPTLDALILRAGETVFGAGPLAKGPGLCHGTSGNGYALLRLHARTGEARWLERARAFATHAMAQLERRRELHGPRFSLWTGDLGVACFLWDCVRGEGGFPTLERFFD